MSHELHVFSSFTLGCNANVYKCMYTNTNVFLITDFFKCETLNDRHLNTELLNYFTFATLKMHFENA